MNKAVSCRIVSYSLCRALHTRLWVFLIIEGNKVTNNSSYPPHLNFGRVVSLAIIPHFLGFFSNIYEILLKLLFCFIFNKLLRVYSKRFCWIYICQERCWNTMFIFSKKLHLVPTFNTNVCSHFDKYKLIEITQS